MARKREEDHGKRDLVNATFLRYPRPSKTKSYKKSIQNFKREKRLGGMAFEETEISKVKIAIALTWLK